MNSQIEVALYGRSTASPFLAQQIQAMREAVTMLGMTLDDESLEDSVLDPEEAPLVLRRLLDSSQPGTDDVVARLTVREKRRGKRVRAREIFAVLSPTGFKVVHVGALFSPLPVGPARAMIVSRV